MLFSTQQLQKSVVLILGVLCLQSLSVKIFITKFTEPFQNWDIFYHNLSNRKVTALKRKTVTSDGLK
jgi:hypothetical protein